MPSLYLRRMAYGGRLPGGGGISNILGGEKRVKSEWEKLQRGM
jgi:hypothetical protein